MKRGPSFEEFLGGLLFALLAITATGVLVTCALTVHRVDVMWKAKEVEK